MPSADLPSPLPDRKTIRLKGFDYTSVGAYFLTVCAREKECIFGHVRIDRTIPNELGSLVEKCWREIPSHFPDVVCDAFTLMPNHMHGILLIFPPSDDCSPVRARHAVPDDVVNLESFGRPIPGSIPTIVRSFKGAVTKEGRIVLQRPDLCPWERGYNDHVIRDGADLKNIRRYIIENPAKWERDQENPWSALIRERRKRSGDPPRQGVT